jgi:hypothetical protein
VRGIFQNGLEAPQCGIEEKATRRRAASRCLGRGAAVVNIRYEFHRQLVKLEFLPPLTGRSAEAS